MIEVDSLTALKKAGFSRISLACGNFDGLHKGHQAIINQLQQSARETASSPAVLTFSPHPREVLTGKKIPSLTADRTKRRLLSEMGVEAIVTIPFTREFAELTARQFVDDVLTVDNLSIEAVCVGSKWRFGAGRDGDVSFLRESALFKVFPVDEVSMGDGLISSSRIRRALSAGDFSDCQESSWTRLFSLRQSRQWTRHCQK